MHLAWWAVGAAGLVSLVSPLLFRRALQRHGIIDRPNDRSSHIEPTLRAGGIAPWTGFVLACVLLASSSVDDQARSVIATVGMAGMLAGLLGLVEDVYGLSVLVRAAGQLLLGTVVAVLLGLIFAPYWWQVVFGALAVSAYVNIANFMDGVNGISGLHGLVVGVAYGFLGLLEQSSWLTCLGLVIAVAFAVFLPWNLRKPGIFLGDVGSYLLGATIASIGVASWFFGIDATTVLAPVAIYLVDTFTTIARRAAREEPVLRSHRSHTYQRLTDTGLSHVWVATIVTFFSLASSLVGVMSLLGWLASWLGPVLIAGICALYVALPHIRGHRLPPRLATRLKPFVMRGTIPARLGFAPASWAVLGASGFVGSALTAHLRRPGHEVREVRAPRLRLEAASDATKAISVMAVRCAELDALATELRGVEVVVNCAGMATPDAAPTAELYGANSLLPPLVYHAARQAGARRIIHLSSAAVQGRRPVLDESADAAPFSPYSRSKALGERAFLEAARADNVADAIVIRATSVQGIGRRTTASLQKISRSPLASVSGTGQGPSVVSSIDGLVDFITRVSVSTGKLTPIMLQPWEGLSVGEVLRTAGGNEPRHLPSWACGFLLACVRQVGRVVPEIAGAGRRLEMMWMGQRQTSVHEAAFPAICRSRLESILSGSDESA